MLIGVDAGADALLGRSAGPDVVVIDAGDERRPQPRRCGPPTSSSGAARLGLAAGLDRLGRPAAPASTPPATAEDAALLLADAHDAT